MIRILTLGLVWFLTFGVIESRGNPLLKIFEEKGHLKVESYLKEGQKPVDEDSDQNGYSSFSNDENEIYYSLNQNESWFNSNEIEWYKKTDFLKIHCYKSEFNNYDVVEINLEEDPNECSITVVIRTPVDQPDITIKYVEPNLDLMIIRHYWLKGSIKSCFISLGQDWSLDFDEVTTSQILPYDNPPFQKEIEECIVDFKNGDWQVRDKGLSKLTSIGKEGAKALYHIQRRGLTPQQNLSIDQFLCGWPVLTDQDKVLLKQILKIQEEENKERNHDTTRPE